MRSAGGARGCPQSARRAQFGIFMDSAPDRWGRTLMQRREALLATQEKRPVRTLMEWDYRLGVHDFSRLGALRFRANPESPFLDNSSTNKAPPLASIRELQAAARAIEEDRGTNDKSLKAALDQLLAPGSSLGGEIELSRSLGMNNFAYSETAVRTLLDLGRLIRAQRRASGLRIDDAAALCGVSVDLLSRLKNGPSGVSSEKLLHVLDGLGLSMLILDKTRTANLKTM